jgi:uncharacterized protein YfiM (DUF2279 family)
MKYSTTLKLGFLLLLGIFFSKNNIAQLADIRRISNDAPYSFNSYTDYKEVDTSVAGIMTKTNKKKVKLVTAINIAGYGGAMIGLYSAWYKDYPQSGFHFFNDNAEWLQVDKAGHAYSAYVESKASMELWRWAGLPRKQRIWIGGLSGAAYQTVIEVLDAFSADWGWSWGDFTANCLGSGLLSFSRVIVE